MLKRGLKAWLARISDKEALENARLGTIAAFPYMGAVPSALPPMEFSVLLCFQKDSRIKCHPLAQFRLPPY